MYRGIEGDNWYLNYISENPFFCSYFDENIDKSWKDANHVDCCTDEIYIKKYLEESKRLGIACRLILCSTDKPMPTFEHRIPSQNLTILGYDYAYIGGSYYSCVLNDILSGRIEEFKNISLNKNGLFPTYSAAKDFSLYREIVKDSSDSFFEDGDFTIYKITEIDVNY